MNIKAVTRAIKRTLYALIAFIFTFLWVMVLPIIILFSHIHMALKNNKEKHYWNLLNTLDAIFYKLQDKLYKYLWE